MSTLNELGAMQFVLSLSKQRKANRRLKAKDFPFSCHLKLALRMGFACFGVAGKNSVKNRAPKVGLLFKWISVVSEIKPQNSK